MGEHSFAINAMKINRILFSITLGFVFLPSIAFAQSFWLHRDVGGPGTLGSAAQLIAIDSNDCILAQGVPDFEVLSTDYWNSWKHVLTDSPKYPLRTYTYGGFCHPSDNLLLVGCNDNSVGQIVRSTDGGATWKDSAIGSSVKNQPGNFITAIAALDSTHIVALVGDTSTYFSDRAMLSSDGGITWQSVSTPIFQHDPRSAGLPANPAVTYLTPNNILVAVINNFANYNSIIYRTTDIGVTWNSGFQLNTTITKFAFINPMVGFTSGIIYDLVAGTDTATIDRTTDGGATWTQILHRLIIPISSYSNTAAGLNSIAFADSLHGFACGEQGLILQTTDGGNTWNEMRSDYTIDAQGNDYLSDVAYPDMNHAMIASGDGSVLVYHPNGILGLPNITYPIFSPPVASQTFDVRWDSVPNATHYSITITTSGYPDSNTSLVLKDTNVTDTFYHLSNLADTAPGQGGRQYQIYLQAFNATNQSNTATRLFEVIEGANGVLTPKDSVFSIAVYPNPAENSISITNSNGPLSILDPLGRSYTVPRTGNTLDISSLPSGVYFVSDGVSRAKFVKE
jgi:photosystem II stability/assembly factor-like uncharacterized protein